MRLHKYLSLCGVCSRRCAEEHIKAGRVTVNGRKVRVMGVTVDPAADRVEHDGSLVLPPAEHVTVALHKPRGFVTSCRHPGERTVLDLISVPGRVYPIGRLDKDSTGLVLLTDDGRLHLALSHPSFDHEKEYEVRVRRAIRDEDLAALASGVVILGKKTRPAQVERLGPRAFRMTLREGRNRQIRRMAEAVGNEVLSLHRVRVGPIVLGELPEGRFRYLSGAENEALLKLLETKK